MTARCDQPLLMHRGAYVGNMLRRHGALQGGGGLRSIEAMSTALAWLKFWN